MSIEDFTTYDESDPNDEITITSSKISVALSLNTKSYVKDDKGADHFGNFEHLVTTQMNNQTPDWHLAIFWGISDDYFTRNDMRANDEGIFVRIQHETTDNIKIYLEDATNDNSDWSIPGCKEDTPYYCTVERNGTTLTCKIYSDATRETLEDTLSIVCTDATYKSIIGFGADNADVHGFVENLDLQEAVAADDFLKPIKYWGA